MDLPDPMDYDFTDPEDVFWYRHDTQMAVLWEETFPGQIMDDEVDQLQLVRPILTPEQRN